MANSIAKDTLYAERNSLRSLLADAPPGDILGRMSLESRLNDVEDQIRDFEATPEMLAETVLYLGGDFVEGSRGIDVDFAADALKRYQYYISVVHAARTQKSPIKEAGPVPGIDSSTLQLVATPRGSFGFVLKEKSLQGRMVASELHESVEIANELIAASAFDSEEDFESALAEVQPRVVKELCAFLATLEKYHASMRLLSSRTDISIDRDDVHSAAARTESVEIIENEETKRGVFLGARKHSRDFNFQPENEEPISGKLGDEIEDRDVSLMNKEYQDRTCNAILSRKETKRVESGRVIIRWTLVDIYLADDGLQLLE